MDDAELEALTTTALARLAEGAPAALDPVAVAAEAGMGQARFASSEALSRHLDTHLAQALLADLSTAAAAPAAPWTQVAAVLLRHQLDPARIALLRHQLAHPGGVDLPRDRVVATLLPLATGQLADRPAAEVSARVMVEWFLALCLGDTELRRLSEALPAPSDQMIATRAAAVDAALDRMLYGVD